MAATLANVFTQNGLPATAQMDGMFKRIFASKLENRCPASSRLQTDIGFDNSATPGEEYQQTVVLQEEQGVTYATSTDDNFALSDPEAGKFLPARVSGSMHVLRTRIGYKAAWAGPGGEKSFENVTKNRVKSMWKTLHKRVEMDMIFGGSEIGLGQDDSAAATTTFIFNTATWAPQMWAGMTGAWVDVWDTAGAAPGDAPTASLGTAQITAINHSTRTLTLATLSSAGTAPRFITMAKVGSTGKGQIDSAAWTTMMGLRVLGRRQTGNLFGISTALDTWQPVIVSGVGTLAFPAFQDAIAAGIGKGLDGNTRAYIPPTSWADLMSDQAALRRYDSSQNASKYSVGAKELEFHSQNGTNSIVVHPYLFPSEAYILQIEDFSRIGTHDVTFKRPSMPGVDREDNYFLELPNNYGFELRCSSDQALFTPAISTIITLTGIT